MITIIIGGDIYPAGSIEKAFMEGNAAEIFHDLLDDISAADLSIVNLESPLVSRETPIFKPGGVIGANIKTINGFVASKWSILNLANNHSFDHGSQGLLETIHNVKKAGLACVGAGENIEKAKKPFIKEIKGERIVIYSMAEREFSIADNRTPGANPLDLINFVNAIRQHKQQGIFIVLIHGGAEFYPYPSPEMVRRCRFMVDMGADAVICCHTHCPLPWEIYADRPIIYSLGNLVFEPLNEVADSWYEGYLARLIIENGHIHFEAIPYFQSKFSSGAKKLNKSEQKLFFDKMGEKCNQVKNAQFLEGQWANYCRQQKDIYLSYLYGYNRIMIKFRKLLLPLLHSKEARYRTLLLVQCETHQEILNTLFKNERHEV